MRCWAASADVSVLWFVCVRVLSTCDILGVHSLPAGGESSVCEATVGLEGDRYCVTGTDYHRGDEEATVCAWDWRMGKDSG